MFSLLSISMWTWTLCIKVDFSGGYEMNVSYKVTLELDAFFLFDLVLLNSVTRFPEGIVLRFWAGVSRDLWTICRVGL
jgi:hypothetical protein